MSFMSFPTKLKEYNDGSLRQKDKTEWDETNGIHAFNRFEEKRVLERFQCHFRLVDIQHNALYALATPAIQE